MIEGYQKGDVIQLLVKGKEAGSIVNEWEELGYAFDLRVRRAKTRGKVVIETTDVIFASRVVTWFSDVRTNVKHVCQ